MKELQGETALVTGASRGIGRAVALALAEAGASVCGTATTEAGAADIAQALEPFGGKGRVLDVRDAANCEALVAELAKDQGLGILVNNAAVTRDNLLLRMSESDWQAVLDTDLTSVFRLSKLVLRGMIKRRHGRIISIGSVVGARGNAGQASYAAAKAGLVGFSKSLAREVGSRGITVNVVAPGFIATDMTRDLSPAVQEALLAEIPAGRLGQPQDVAAAVRFLASASAGYISGETINVNGGLLMV